MKRNRERLFILIGAVLMQFSIGAIYSWSLFNNAIHHQFGWNIDEILITYSLIIYIFALTTVISGRLLDRFGPRFIGSIGAILYGVGVILTSRADSLYEFYIFYGVIAGIGVGLVYVCPLTTCIKWFPNKKGLATGIVIGAFGLGSLIFKPIIQVSLIDSGLSKTFLKLGIIYLITTFLGAQLLKNPIKENIIIQGDSLLDFSVRDMIKTKNFYFIWISFFFACIGGLFIIGSVTDIATELGIMNLKQAAGTIVVIAICNALGRLFWGAISDHIGGKLSAIIMFLITTISLLTLSYIELSIIPFYILIALITLCFGGFLVIYPSLTTEYFGILNLGKNYGVIYQAYGLAALVGPIILKIFPNYTTVFFIAGIISGVGALFILQIKK